MALGPLTFDLRAARLRRGGDQGDREEGAAPVVRPFDADVPFDKRWDVAAAMARRSHRLLELAAFLSPAYRREPKLVVCLRDLGPRTPSEGKPYYAFARGAIDTLQGVPVPKGRLASDYHFLVCDSQGKPVALTEFGRGWLRTHSVKPRRGGSDTLSLGESVGFVFPLREMFGLKRGNDYSAMVVLPAGNENRPGWAAGPVPVRVPEPEIPGINRPPLGSYRIWDRLLLTAGAVRGPGQARVDPPVRPAMLAPPCFDTVIANAKPGSDGANLGFDFGAHGAFGGLTVRSQ